MLCSLKVNIFCSHLSWIRFAFRFHFSLLKCCFFPSQISSRSIDRGSEREICWRGSFWKSRLKKRGRVKWSGDLLPLWQEPHAYMSIRVRSGPLMYSSKNLKSSKIAKHTHYTLHNIEGFLGPANEGEENNIYAKGRSGGARIELCRWKKLIALPLPEARPR